ncbi:hypothetical protein DFJ73DRAFT_832677 [Zopfochytrium polystomum]|nr:hypothetical protein DFJ73DRAFT_832677 [Zopfochytrium polystomum]
MRRGGGYRDGGEAETEAGCEDAEGRATSSGTAWSNAGDDADDEDEESLSRAAEGPWYLAQHDLFSQVPELRDDIIVPDYCYWEADEDGGDTPSPSSSRSASPAPARDDVSISAWFGPGGTVSPLHTDPRDNLFAQVMGRKYVRLYAPTETERVYPHEEEMLRNSSRVDAENPDLEAFPLFAEADYEDCIVEPGDLLFIPKGWWHYVRSLEVSFSVSFWYG